MAITCTPSGLNAIAPTVKPWLGPAQSLTLCFCAKFAPS